MAAINPVNLMVGGLVNGAIDHANDTDQLDRSLQGAGPAGVRQHLRLRGSARQVVEGFGAYVSGGSIFGEQAAETLINEFAAMSAVLRACRRVAKRVAPSVRRARLGPAATRARARARLSAPQPPTESRATGVSTKRGPPYQRRGLAGPRPSLYVPDQEKSE
jgi:hypothetical protein